MALRITDLTSAATFAGTGEFEFSLTGAGGSRKITGSNLRAQLLGSGTGFTDSDPLKAGAASTIQAGGSTTYCKPALVMSQTGGGSTTSAVESSLASYSLPAGTLSTNHQMVRIRVSFEFVPSAAETCNYNVKFGSTQLEGETGISPAQSITVDAIVRRVGATSQKATSVLVRSAQRSNTTSPAETLSGAITIDARGLVSAGTASLTCTLFLVEFIGA